MRKAHFDLAGKAGEIEYLLYFFLDALPAIHGLLNRILNKLNCRVSVGGVFCHQTPKVSSVSPQSQPPCELGDILFLTVYDQPRLIDGIGLGNASLVQAKLERDTPDGPQRILYEKTDVFEYRSPKALLPQQRSLCTAMNCLWYWNIEPPPFEDSCGMGVARPPTYWNDWDCVFGRFLFDLFSGVLGRGVSRQPGGTSWNQIVHDLLHDTAKRDITRRSVKIVNGSRISNTIATLAALGANPKLRLVVGDVEALYASVGYGIEIPSTAFEEVPAAAHGPPPKDRTPLSRGDEDEGESITTIIIKFSAQE